MRSGGATRAAAADSAIAKTPEENKRQGTHPFDTGKKNKHPRPAHKQVGAHGKRCGRSQQRPRRYGHRQPQARRSMRQRGSLGRRREDAPLAGTDGA
ncbi:hypothetical protein HPB50_016356 [Hyalomma asiaticum]|uniref:Uncharacterized protein n=1 Tax=Hyalomma asiaticum TaxID=266040 RepID=A0ACB7SRE5_HYAAI|nr:hypothetical protein HPB50_016356 [Hyalomma asiaticum]